MEALRRKQCELALEHVAAEEPVHTEELIDRLQLDALHGQGDAESTLARTREFFAAKERVAQSLFGKLDDLVKAMSEFHSDQRQAFSKSSLSAETTSSVHRERSSQVPTSNAAARPSPVNIFSAEERAASKQSAMEALNAGPDQDSLLPPVGGGFALGAVDPAIEMLLSGNGARGNAPSSSAEASNTTTSTVPTFTPTSAASAAASTSRFAAVASPAASSANKTVPSIIRSSSAMPAMPGFQSSSTARSALPLDGGEPLSAPIVTAMDAAAGLNARHRRSSSSAGERRVPAIGKRKSLASINSGVPSPTQSAGLPVALAGTPRGSTPFASSIPGSAPGTETPVHPNLAALHGTPSTNTFATAVDGTYSEDGDDGDDGIHAGTRVSVIAETVQEEEDEDADEFADDMADAPNASDANERPASRAYSDRTVRQ